MAAHCENAPATHKFLDMSTSTTNRKVHQVDVLRSGGTPSALSPERTEEASTRTLQRGLRLLDAILDSGRDGQRVVDLCHATGLERATVHRLLATLVECGYVAVHGRFRYVMGPRLAERAHHVEHSNFAARLQPVLARVSAACGDAAFAIVREGPTSHCIARHVGTHPVQILVIQIGTRQPLGVGAAGLALLAALPDEDVDAAIAANAPDFVRYGNMNPDRMKILVRSTRERGWSVIGNHATRGVLAVGMAVLSREGTPQAAISVASTMERMPRDRQQLIARAMRDALATLLPDGL